MRKASNKPKQRKEEFIMNNVNLIGRTTKESDLRFTPEGKAVATVTLAVNRNFENAKGEREADFIQVVIWGKRAEAFANHVKKGHQVGVTGELRTRNYDEMKDGQPTGKKVYVTEVLVSDFTFLEKKEKVQA
ncbi:single-strand binding protein [Bacillus phage MG-B1]|uniref:Single-stranded DNA-binding protein n=1 Tax=Bacillus phage MG-B1 TaxID=1309583 RepID=M4W9P8_9CAUD|nr:single strand DNA binding protein [Bacillus phage MG-B1]AGI10608.1 single-strand binding protein [Bacillus phage MG-B1]